MLNEEQRRRFVEQGYVVIPQVVSRPLIAAARQAVQDLLEQQPPPPDHRGPYAYFLTHQPLPQALCALLFKSEAIAAVASLIAPGKLAAPEHVQVALTIPPFPHRPGGPHVDGITPTEEDGRPGTFTMLAGIFLTDQSRENSGNLWVWPRSHLATAAYLRERGPEALAKSPSYPPVSLAEPRQVTGRAGDLLLAHYLLGHNLGGNVSEVTRETVYFRLRREGHRERWREAVQDPLLEFMGMV